MSSRNFTIPYSTGQATEDLKLCLAGAEKLYRRVQGIGISQRAAAELASFYFTPIHNLLVDELLRLMHDDMTKRLCADYYNARAFFLGMEGRVREGRSLHAKAHEVMRGGDWEERCQDYFHA